jgi:hypothetical protein
MKQLDRITMDPAVIGGKPCIRGMRVTVGTVVGPGVLMKFLIDMSLSPDWIDVLTAEGWEALIRSRVQGQHSVPVCFCFAGDRWADVTE